MNRRGGSRVGAGRKATLTWEQRLALGAACERRFNDIWSEAVKRSWEQRSGVDEIRGIHAEFRSISIPERRAFMDSEAGRELAEEAEEAVRSIRRTPAFVEHTNRVFHLSAPRPKGVRKIIMSEVAEAYSLRWGIKVSPRLTERCWNDFRDLQRRFDADGD